MPPVFLLVRPCMKWGSHRLRIWWSLCRLDLASAPDRRRPCPLSQFLLMRPSLQCPVLGVDASYVGCCRPPLHAIELVGLSCPHLAVLHSCMYWMRAHGQIAFGLQNMYVLVLCWFVPPTQLVVINVVQVVSVAKGLVLNLSYCVKPCR